MRSLAGTSDCAPIIVLSLFFLLRTLSFFTWCQTGWKFLSSMFFFPPPANKQLSFTALRYCLFLLSLREHIYLTFYFSRKSQTDLCVLLQRGSPSYSCSYSYIHTRERHSANTLSYCRPPRSSAGQMAPNQKSEVTAAHQRRGEGRVQV